MTEPANDRSHIDPFRTSGAAKSASTIRIKVTSVTPKLIAHESKTKRPELSVDTGAYAIRGVLGGTL
jgi:hypothetical protein